MKIDMRFYAGKDDRGVTKEKDNYRKHAERELDLMGYTEKESGMNGMMRDDIFELLDIFSKQGHSGSSAPHCISLFSKLANFEPLLPITCNKEEWGGSWNDETFQNNRLPSVFKDGIDGKPYYLNAIIWEEEGGCCFSGTVDGITSYQFIKLPFVPKKFYVKVSNDRQILDRKTLNEAFEYYDCNVKILEDVPDVPKHPIEVKVPTIEEMRTQKTDYTFDNLDEKYRSAVERIIEQHLNGVFVKCHGIQCHDCPFDKTRCLSRRDFIPRCYSYLHQLDALRDAKKVDKRIDVIHTMVREYLDHNDIAYLYRIDFSSKTRFDVDSVGDALIDTINKVADNG